jgi:hypothetical protein
VSYPHNIRTFLGNGGLTRLVQIQAAPSVQSIPTTIAGIDALSGRSFTEWYVANMGSGSLVGANGTTLTAAGSPRYSRTVPGWNGTDYTTGYRAVEFDGSTAAFLGGTTGLYDLDQSICFVLCLRVLRNPGITNILAKKLSYATGDIGYVVYFNNEGDVVVEVSNGSSQVAAVTVATAAELDGVCNGALHWLAFPFNLTTREFQILAYRQAGTAVALPTGSLTTLNGFKLGNAIGFLTSAPLLQLVAFGVLTGTEAEAFDIDDLNAIDNWCAAPSGTEYNRTSVVAPIIGSDSTGVRVQHCAGSSSTTGLIHAGHAYAAAASSEGQVGVLCERGIQSLTSFACRNRLLATDDLSDVTAWTHSNITPTKNAGEDPAGFTGAAQLTATASNAFIRQNFTGDATVTLAWQRFDDHTVSVFAQRAQSTDVAARLSLYNSATGVEIDGVDITITALRQRFSLTVPATTINAVTTLQWRLTIYASGDSIYATFAQGEHGWLRSYQPQRASLLARGGTEWWIDNAAADKLHIAAGKVTVTCVGLVETVNASGSFVWSTDCGASFEDRIFQQRDALISLYPNDTQHYDSAGVLVAQMSAQPTRTHTDEITYSYQWDSRVPVWGSTSVRALATIDQAEVTTGLAPTAAWTTGASADRVILGSRHSLNAHLEGIITTVEIWSGV